jgi:uncharacterized protein YuzE
MGKEQINQLISLVPNFLGFENIWMNYDKGADVLYINFKKPSRADETEHTADDIIIRYENSEIIGITILNAGKRNYKF